MTWEETIRYIRSKVEYNSLVNQSYLHEDLELNVKRFSESDEFTETLKLIESKKQGCLRILDVGCGNGIASVTFALKGHNVVAFDPDSSNTVGTGAVQQLKEKLGLNALSVLTTTAEKLKLEPDSFDVVYCRQAMHHAHSLNKFISNCVRFLKKDGLFLTIRDHVIFDHKDKQKFLNEHPLHKFYGGENAYQRDEYRKAFQVAGLEITQEIRFFDSIINYFPLSLNAIEDRISNEKELIHKNLKRRLGKLGHSQLTYALYKYFVFNPERLRQEQFYSGRMYSYICRKK